MKGHIVVEIVNVLCLERKFAGEQNYLSMLTLLNTFIFKIIT